MNSIIQFTHPGVQRNLPKRCSNGIAEFFDEEKTHGIRKWNIYRQHYRKFIKHQAQYLTNLQNPLTSGEVCFWGEWEAPSFFTLFPSIDTKDASLPWAVHEIVACEEHYLNSPEHAQNTDPFVFGDSFFYSCCKQGGKMKRMRELERGSVILFGSPLNNKEFVLDTVFVVGDDDKYQLRSDNDRRKKDSEFAKWVSSMIYQKFVLDQIQFGKNNDNIDEDDDNHSSEDEKFAPKCVKTNAPKYRDSIFTLYKSVMYADRGDYCGMFSFVPCKPFTDSFSPESNQRIVLDAEKFHFASIAAGTVCSDRRVHCTGTVVEYWQMLVDEILGKGYSLATHFPLPTYYDLEAEAKQAFSSKKLNLRSV